MSTDLAVLRVVLLITLSAMVLWLLYRRFRYNTLQKHVPVVRHAELTGLNVGYHPNRLLVSLQLPGEQQLAADVLNDRWERVHGWPMRLVEVGAQRLELPLDGLADGTYYLRLLSEGQSTERQFILRST
ncbi:MAG: hypothetical protein WAU70_11890 [Flavobacteriales bacterium]